MDFDGVIADSISECAVSGFNGYGLYNEKSLKVTDPGKIDPNKLIIFNKTRPFIRSGEDYIYLFQAIEERVIINSQSDFDSFKNKYLNRNELYRSYFKQAREWLMNTQKNEWIKLNPIYNGMKEFLNSNSLDMHIISTKASKFINEILLQNEISIKENNVHSTQDGLSKSEILTKIMLDSNYDPINTYYIDDHLDTLTKMKSTKANCLLATWGYNNNDVDVNQNNSILMIDLKNFYRSFSIS